MEETPKTKECCKRRKVLRFDPTNPCQKSYSEERSTTTLDIPPPVVDVLDPPRHCPPSRRSNRASKPAPANDGPVDDGVIKPQFKKNVSHASSKDESPQRTSLSNLIEATFLEAAFHVQEGRRQEEEALQRRKQAAAASPGQRHLTSPPTAVAKTPPTTPELHYKNEPPKRVLEALQDTNTTPAPEDDAVKNLQVQKNASHAKDESPQQGSLLCLIEDTFLEAALHVQEGRRQEEQAAKALQREEVAAASPGRPHLTSSPPTDVAKTPPTTPELHYKKKRVLEALQDTNTTPTPMDDAVKDTLQVKKNASHAKDNESPQQGSLFSLIEDTFLEAALHVQEGRRQEEEALQREEVAAGSPGREVKKKGSHDNDDESSQRTSLSNLIEATFLEAALHVQEGQRQEELRRKQKAAASSPGRRHLTSPYRVIPISEFLPKGDTTTTTDVAKTLPETLQKRRRHRKHHAVPPELHYKKEPSNRVLEAPQDTSSNPPAPKRKRRRRKLIIPRELQPKKEKRVLQVE